MMGITMYTSATPGPYEMEKNDQVVEQIIRPTGLLDPQLEVRPTKGQVDDLIVELRSATAGVGTFRARFDHLAELTGRLADQAIERAGTAKAA